MHTELHKGEIVLSTDPSRLDLDAIYDFLSKSYWARSRPRAMIEKSIRNSLCFGVYDGRSQIGFARAITDYAIFAYLADVYILEPYRGRGLGKWLIRSILECEELRGLRRWCLITQDAQPLYLECGFSQLPHPDQYMELVRPYPAIS
jgi:GNAT superfamily N-acetyltransferase